MPVQRGRMRRWMGPSLIAVGAVAALVVGLLVGFTHRIPGSASVEPAYAAQHEVFDAALALALTPAVQFSGSFTSDTGQQVGLDAQVSNEGSMLATLTLAGQEADYLATGDRRFVRADEQIWSALGESAANAATYAGVWAQVDNDFLGVDLGVVLAPARVAWVIADPAGLAATGAPGALEQVNGVPARPVRAGELTVWLSQDDPLRIVRIRAETSRAGDSGNLLPHPNDPAATGDPDEEPGTGSGPDDPPVEDPDVGVGPEELDIPDFEADLSEEAVEQAQELLEQSIPDQVRELTESIDSRVSFELTGDIVLAPCGPSACTATVSLTNTITSANPNVTVTQPVNAEVTTNMTLDSVPVQTCVSVVPMPPNGGGSTQCTATYSVPASQNPRVYTVRALATAIARALVQTDIDGILTDLAEQEARLDLSRTYRSDMPGGGLWAYEGLGKFDGHTVQDHTGASRQAVIAGAVDHAESSYLSEELAEDTIAAALADPTNAPIIQSWLDGNGTSTEVSYHGTSVTGLYAVEGGTEATEVTGALVRLLRLSRGGDFGYIIRTSYPIP